jgi:hypothetical protein
MASYPPLPGYPPQDDPRVTDPRRPPGRTGSEQLPGGEQTDAAAERAALADALAELDLQCQANGLGTLPQVLAQMIRERHGLTLGAV